MHVTVVLCFFVLGFVCCFLGFLAQCRVRSVFAKGNSEKILFLQAGQIVSICSS